MRGRPASNLMGAALVQGLTVVSFPASAALLKQTRGLTDAQYGSLFIPQTALTIAGALTAGVWAQRAGLPALLRVALACSAAAELALAATSTFSAHAYALLLVGAGLMGAGFGIASAPLNALPARLFPRRAASALVAVHTAVGAGFALGPLAIGALAARDEWAAFPSGLAALAALVAIGVPASAGAPADTAAVGHAAPARSAVFWLFAAIAVLYALAEGTFSNWTLVFLREERALSDASAALALSAFWAALVLGRLLVSVLVTRVSSTQVWLCLPPIMAAAFVALPAIDGTRSAVAGFGLAGLGCSAFFPLTVGLAAQRFAARADWTAAMLTAALMLGVGLGSFVLGPLRGIATLAEIYRASALWPLAALVVAALVARTASSRRISSATDQA